MTRLTGSGSELCSCVSFHTPAEFMGLGGREEGNGGGGGEGGGSGQVHLFNFATRQFTKGIHLTNPVGKLLVHSDRLSTITLAP